MAKKEKNTLTGLLSKIAKIEKLPKDIVSSLPFCGILQNGIIETSPGTFSKTYRFSDTNFSMLEEEEQIHFLHKYIGNILNTFNEGVKWQFTLFNHEIDKRKTLEDILIKPYADGLNKYRREENEFLASTLKHGNNSLTQDKYLTISINDNNIEHAIATINKNDIDIARNFNKLTGKEAKPLSLEERLHLLYSIYNQNYDYRLTTGVYDGKEKLDLKHLAKCGLSFKDIIGPTSMQWGDKSFVIGDKYGQAFYLERVPHTKLTTDFVRDICDIQTNSLVSITYEPIKTDKAIKITKNEIASVESKMTSSMNKSADMGFVGAFSPELEKRQEAARDLLDDIITRDQRTFFVSLTVVLFSSTKDGLENAGRVLKSVASEYDAPLKVLKFQQEFGFNTALPLCRNDLFTEILLTAESTCAFIPFNAVELQQKDAVFYGINDMTKSMLLYDRRTNDNYTGLFFGKSGSGKSTAAKHEMISTRLSHPEDQIFIIDPQGEYASMAQGLNGEKITLTPGSKTYINPLDLNISDVDDEGGNPIAKKIDFVIDMIKIMKKSPLSAQEERLVAKATAKLYEPYVRELERIGKSIDTSICPTLTDLYHELNLQKRNYPEAEALCEALASYTIGQFDNFAHRTNVVTNNNFIVYDIKSIGTKIRELAYQICLNDLSNRMIENSKKGIFTRMYFDEAHILLESDSATSIMKRIWLTGRKWLGVPTAITPNITSFLKNTETMEILNTTSFIVAFNSSLMNRNALQDLLNLSSSQIEKIEDSDVGCGLLYNGKMTMPFSLDYPRDTQIYKMMSTKKREDIKGV